MGFFFLKPRKDWELGGMHEDVRSPPAMKEPLTFGFPALHNRKGFHLENGFFKLLKKREILNRCFRRRVFEREEERAKGLSFILSFLYFGHLYI